MGAWGTSLYANDTTCDIRGDYVEKLRFGKNNEDATREIIEENRDIFGDCEEEPLFWFALADIQWNYGRLLPEVRRKALFFLEKEEEFERWEDSAKGDSEKWKKTLNDLKEKLNKQQPAEKKVSKYRSYRCKWNLGDVYAYRFESELSKEQGFYGKYVVFRKVSEARWYPKQIVPVVQVYKWIGDDVPDLNYIKTQKLLEQGFFSSVLKNKPYEEIEFTIKLLSTSDRVIPQTQLTFLGNLLGDDLVPYDDTNECKYLGIPAVGWQTQKYNNKFEKYIIEMYLSWKNID